MADRMEMTYSDYRVQIGHAVVSVKGRTRDEALALARRQLSDQLPRMWDVIHSAAPSRFQIQYQPPIARQ